MLKPNLILNNCQYDYNSTFPKVRIIPVTIIREFLSVLLRYNWHTAMCKQCVRYNWHTAHHNNLHILQNDNHNGLSTYPPRQIPGKRYFSLWWELPGSILSNFQELSGSTLFAAFKVTIQQVSITVVIVVHYIPSMYISHN